METFGQRLKKARTNKKITQKQLAEVIGAKHNSVSNWENGQNKPDPDTLELICGALDIEPNYLLQKTSSNLIEQRKESYYVNEETKQIAQRIFENKELRALFDAGNNATPEDLNIVKNLLLQLKNKEAGK